MIPSIALPLLIGLAGTPAAVVLPDSVLYVTEPVIVIGTTTTSSVDPSATTVDAITLAAHDVRSAADLGPVLPATRVIVNSRGESQFMVRGASERHVRLWLDGIPLNIPWDERVDASLVPVDAIGSVRAVRGVSSVLDGPNALSGTVDLQPATLPADGRRTRLGLQFGQAQLREGRAMHQMRRGDWDVLAAGSWRRQDGFLVPEDYSAPFNQGGDRQRTNSDLEQSAAIVRVQRRFGDAGSWHVTLLGNDGEKGVPPETHLADGARYWRFPDVRRGLLGLGLRLPLDAERRWDLVADLAADVSHQEIRAFDDATYTTPALAPGVEYETDNDRTGLAQVRATRRLGAATTVTTQVSARYAHHRESLAYEGPELDYSQFLGAVAAEADLALGNPWRLRIGTGWDLASTPETGDKPSRDATTAPALLVRVERARLHAAYSRRSRFPALRELYSGALNRFAPNPDLDPERQDLGEIGWVARGAGWEAGLTAFAAFLRGGIERIVLADGTRRFQRVNVDEIRTLGGEAVASWRPAPRWEVGLHHTILDSRRKAAGEYGAWAEDRPAYISFASVAWRPGWDLRLAIEAMALGPRMSADAADTNDGMRRLPAQGTVNLRVAKILGGNPRSEIWARVDNIFDAEVDAQTGLPQPGRTVGVGMGLLLDAWSAQPVAP